MRYLSLIVAAIMFNVICCTGEIVKEKSTPTIANDGSFNLVARRANQFSLNLFQRFCDLTSGNAVFAPYEYFISDSMASYPLMNTSPESDLEALVSAGIVVNMLRGLQALVEKIETFKSFNFNSVSKIFHRVDFEPVAAFSVAVKKYTLSEPQVLDMHNRTKAMEIINEWAKNITQNRIPNAVQYDDLLPKVALYYINVIHFKRSWSRPFSLVGDDDFYVDGTQPIKIPFMRQLDFFEYGDLPSTDAKVIRIPYKNNDSDDGMSMFIILPNKLDGFAEVKKNIGNVKLIQLFRGKPQEILLFVPKFKVESKFMITKPLENTLSRRSNVTDNHKKSMPSPRIGKVIQRVLFEVDEQSECADKNASATPGTPILKINRPFIFIIATTERNRVILFTGYFSGSQHEEV